ncbi:type II toxin-antitoxin system RelE/ParE family toxin [Paenarthrobacter sp. MSM-2-10-13]|uniref:type II toxin-antitoxin system RelE family toxin n=1 Tax=Paenarthrobacter sp. MSM-2-10-13 TaxID=2717318 RepID=UPI0032668563
MNSSPKHLARQRQKLSGNSGDWRVRTGDFRIIYEIRDAQLIVLVVAMGHRRDIYQH